MPWFFFVEGELVEFPDDLADDRDEDDLPATLFGLPVIYEDEAEGD